MITEKTREELLAEVREARLAYDVAFFGEASFEHIQACSMRLARATLLAATPAERIHALEVEAADYGVRAANLRDQQGDKERKARERNSRQDAGLYSIFMQMAAGSDKAATALERLQRGCLERAADIRRAHPEVAAQPVRPG